MKHLRRSFRAISPVLAVLMMIAIAIAGALVVYAWVMGYIDFSTETAGQAIVINGVANLDTDLLVYVQNTGEGTAQLEEEGCLYVNGQLIPCMINGVTVSDSVASLGQGETATLTYFGGLAPPGEKVDVKVTALSGKSATYYDYPAGISDALPGFALWNKTYGGTGIEYACSVVATSDGGYVIAGTTESFGAGGSDWWLIKVNSWGKMEWNQTYGGTGNDTAGFLVATPDGGYAILGSYNEPDLFDFWSDKDFRLVKTDESGNMKWSQTYRVKHDDWFSSMIVTSDGGYAITGSTTPLGAEEDDLWLIKTDMTGNIQWNKTYGDPDSEQGGLSLLQTSDGGYVLAGGNDDSGSGDDDFWLVKTDETGTVEWNKTYGGPDIDFVQSLVATPDGGYLLTGFTGQFFHDEGLDCWMVKTDSSGNMIWNQTYESPGNEKYFFLTTSTVVVTSDEGYALAGTTVDNEKCWLIKTDKLGNIEWNQTYGGTANVMAASLVLASDGGYVLAGNIETVADVDIDFWLIKIYTKTG